MWIPAKHGDRADRSHRLSGEEKFHEGGHYHLANTMEQLTENEFHTQDPSCEKCAGGKDVLAPQASRDKGKSQFPEGKSADESGAVRGQLSRDLAEKQ